MKQFFILILVFVLLVFCSCQENVTENISVNTTENSTEMSKKNETSKLGISFKLLIYLNSLKNLTIIEKEKLNEIFMKMYEIIIDDPSKEKNETHLEMINKFTDEVFNLLADKEKNVIIVENIFESFNPTKIIEYITKFLKDLDLDSILNSLISTVIKFLGNMFLNFFKNTDL